jgi:hypothetical protein
MGDMTTSQPFHPARRARHVAGVASVAAFVGAAIGVATHGHNGQTQPAGAATAPSTTTTTSAPNFGGDDGWGATAPDDDWGFSNPQGNQQFVPPSHSQSGGS